MSERPLVLYHKACADGAVAAWVARRTLTNGEFVPVQYGEPVPDVTGREVFVLDFSYPFEVLMRMAGQARSIVLLDHHATAQRDLAAVDDLPQEQRANISITFDMNRSGAGLARDYFCPEFKHWIVDYTQDRDLWQFKLPRSRTVNAYLQALPRDDLEAIEQAHQHVLSWGEAVTLGEGAELYAEGIVRASKGRVIVQRFAGYDGTPVVNIAGPAYSEAIGAIAEEHGAAFAVGWFQAKDGAIIYSLRSRGDFDCSKLAEQFGGGGHKGAAGFRLSWSVPLVELPRPYEPPSQAEIERAAYALAFELRMPVALVAPALAKLANDMRPDEAHLGGQAAPRFQEFMRATDAVIIRAKEGAAAAIANAAAGPIVEDASTSSELYDLIDKIDAVLERAANQGIDDEACHWIDDVIAPYRKAVPA